MINEGGGGQQKVTSFYRGGHQKGTLGDMGGGRGQKSQKRGDVLCERPLWVLLGLTVCAWVDLTLLAPHKMITLLKF